MTVAIRFARSLFDRIRADLSRPHPFAAERIGFAYGDLVDAGTRLILMTAYEPVGDDDYIDDPMCGARIDSQAIRTAMQGVLNRRQGAFHVHMHRWPGQPFLSKTDAAEIPDIVTGLRRVGTTFANGILLLHDIECAGWVWLPGAESPVEADSVSVVGFPFHISRRVQE